MGNNNDPKIELVDLVGSVISSISSLTSDSRFFNFCVGKIGLKKTYTLVSSFAKICQTLAKIFD